MSKALLPTVIWANGGQTIKLFAHPELFKHSDKLSHVAVQHSHKDVSVGALRNIYRQTGWELK
ncbi:type II toxin-antitoxin system HicA family toxin [Methyloglobulus sp.]|uniref:type II toxin-antitoxin system HicA family toxin n=1 Tax=Methyloglobulus sp. TaxID=2518622 RepID=UPI003989A57C